jgi:hypothetical protein
MRPSFQYQVEPPGSAHCKLTQGCTYLEQRQLYGWYMFYLALTSAGHHRTPQVKE